MEKNIYLLYDDDIQGILKIFKGVQSSSELEIIFKHETEKVKKNINIALFNNVINELSLILIKYFKKKMTVHLRTKNNVITIRFIELLIESIVIGLIQYTAFTLYDIYNLIDNHQKLKKLNIDYKEYIKNKIIIILMESNFFI